MPPIPTTSEFTDKTSFTAGNLEETTTNDIFFYWGSTSTDLFINITTELSTENSNPYPAKRDNISTTVLFVSLSFVIGCFALTALILRIGSRLKKAKVEAKEKKRHQRMTMNNKMKAESQSQTHQKLTIRMHVGQESVNRRSNTNHKQQQQSIPSKGQTELKLNPLALNLPDSASHHQQHNQQGGGKTQTAGKRSRTLEALIEIGAFPPDYTLQSGLDPTKDVQQDTYERSIMTQSAPYSTERKRGNRVKLDLSTEGAAYTNKAFDLSSPDKIQDVFSQRKQYVQIEHHRYSNEDDRSNRTHGRAHEYSQLMDEGGASSTVTSDKEDKDMSEESCYDGKEMERMLDPARYRDLSSSEDETSPLSTRGYFHMKYLRHYDKNRNNSRDSGYVESVASQDSIKKRKLGIVEPFYHCTLLEEQIRPKTISGSDDIFLSHCPTCHSLTPPKQQSLHPQNDFAIVKSGDEEPAFKMSPFRKEVNVSYRSPYHHLPLGQSSSYALGYQKRSVPPQTYTRSYSVVNDNADYNLKCAFLPPNRFVKKLDSETQTEGAPLHRKSTVRWKKEGANYILTPMEDNEIDHLGPIYLTSE